MTTNISSDFFTASVQATQHELSFCENTPKSLEYWLSQLPSIQLGDSAKSLFNALVEILSLDCKETLRFDLVQVLHISVEQILGTLEKHFSENLSFHSGHNENVIELAQQFRCYMAKIYSHIALTTDEELKQSNFSLFSFRQKKKLTQLRTTSTYFALEQFSLLKYQQLMLYKNAFVGQWRIAHQLFYMASEAHFDHTDITTLCPNVGKEKLNAIRKVYKQINLLDLLNTHQVRPIEIHALYQCSFQWINLIHLSKNEASLSRYFIDIRKDYPPVLNNLHLPKAESNLFIETQGLLEHINLINLPQNKGISQVEKTFLSPSLIFHVQHLLNNTPERRYERYDFTSTIQLAFSLQSAHYYLSNTTEFEETLQLGSQFNVPSDSGLLPNWNTEAKPAVVNKPFVRLDQTSKHIYSCAIMDISVNGYRMRWKGKVPKQLRTGEFILVQENTQSPWRAGVIRWLKQMPDKHIEFGVEILSQEITPCALQLLSNKDTRNYHPALLLRNDVLNEVTLSMIVPGSQIFKEQQSVFLRLGRKQIKVYFTKAKLISQSFTQLDFELLNEEEKSLVDAFIAQHAETIKKQDLWESLK